MSFTNSNQVVKAIMKGQVFTKTSSFEYVLDNATCIVIPEVAFKICLNGELVTNYGNAAEGKVLAEKLVTNAASNSNTSTTTTTDKASIERKGDSVTCRYKGTTVFVEVRVNTYWNEKFLHVSINGDKAVGEKLVSMVQSKWADLAYPRAGV